MKFCNNCKQSKAFTEFSAKGKKLQSHCKVCQRKRSQTWYSKNKEIRRATLNARCKKLAAEAREWVDAYKTAHPCVDCNKYYHPWQMDFDHLTDKLFNISRAVKDGQTLARIKEEIGKCELVCANCHRNRTYFRRVGTSVVGDTSGCDPEMLSSNLRYQPFH